jgi:hypothetical protein
VIFYSGTERIFEDHENLVENLLNWTRDSQNKLIFMERIEKYALFKNPQVRLNNLWVLLNVCCYSITAKLIELKD